MADLLDYGERTDSTAAIADGATVFTSASLAFDGSTRIMFELFFPNVNCTDGAFSFHLYDNGVDAGVIQYFFLGTGGAHEYCGYAATFLTPTAGTHTFTVISDLTATTSTINKRSWYRIRSQPATEIDYVTRTTDFSGSNPFITSNSIVYDGSTRVRIDVICPGLSTIDDTTVDLLEDGGSIGNIGFFGVLENFKPSLEQVTPLSLTRFLTPAAGTHTYSVEVTTGGSVVCYCATATYRPGFIRITDVTN